MFLKPEQSKFQLEKQLIIGCSQTVLTSQQVENISSILRQPIDWDYIFKVSTRNGVNPLVSRNLLEKFGSLLTAEVRKELHDRYQEHIRHNMFMTLKLVEIIKLFKREGISIMPFKGPLLALRAYGDVSFRRFIDLDVLVQPEDLKRSVDLLSSHGYKAITNLNWLNKTKANWYINRIKDIGFVSNDGRVRLELHWKLSGAHFSFPLEQSRLWQQLEASNLAGLKVKSLPFNTLLIYLCLHGSRHNWERFNWICDVNELVRSEQKIDWSRLSKEADKIGCKNTLALGLYLVFRVFGFKPPIPNWREIENDSVLKEIADLILLRLFSEELVETEIGDRYLNHLKLKEKGWDKMKLHLHYNFWYLKLIFSPNEADKNSFHLPSWLSPFYYVLRPPRLFFNYLKKRVATRKNI